MNAVPDDKSSEPGQAMHQRGLSRTRRTHNRGKPASLEGNRNVIKCFHLGTADHVNLRTVFHTRAVVLVPSLAISSSAGSVF
jgi:hypothetical protein